MWNEMNAAERIAYVAEMHAEIKRIEAMFYRHQARMLKLWADSRYGTVARHDVWMGQLLQRMYNHMDVLDAIGMPYEA